MVVTYHDRQLSILWPMHQPRQCHRKCCFSFFFFPLVTNTVHRWSYFKICQWVENQTIIIHLLTNKTRHRHFKNLSPTEKLQQFYRYIMTNICQICQKFQIQVHANSNECQSTIPGFLISKKCFHRFKLSFFFQEDQTKDNPFSY